MALLYEATEWYVSVMRLLPLQDILALQMTIHYTHRNSILKKSTPASKTT